MWDSDEFVIWSHFQVLESQDVLNGELVLPSGMTLPLGAMIVALRRKQVMKEILQVGEIKGVKERWRGMGVSSVPESNLANSLCCTHLSSPSHLAMQGKGQQRDRGTERAQAYLMAVKVGAMHV